MYQFISTRKRDTAPRQQGSYAEEMKNVCGASAMIY